MSNVQSTTDSIYNPYDAINAAGQTDAAKSSSSIKDQEDRFLKLLVTQLKNQDPMNPMDNAQMTSQLAQMSTVSGIEKLNATLATLMQNLGASQSMEASAMIGKGVLVPGEKLALPEGKTAFGGARLGADADKVVVKISNAAGQVVQTQDMGAQKAGVLNFSWDGQTDLGAAAPAGDYSFTVEATRGSHPVAVDALQLGMVSALVRSGSSFLLDVAGVGRIDFKEVEQIL